MFPFTMEATVEDLITVKEASEILGIKPQRVLNLIKTGKLPARKVGWFWIINRKDVCNQSNS